MDIFSQFCLIAATIWCIGEIVATIITVAVTKKRVGGLTFIRAGRLSLSYCVVRGGR